jgi:hypothetical protein
MVQGNLTAGKSEITDARLQFASDFGLGHAEKLLKQISVMVKRHDVQVEVKGCGYGHLPLFYVLRSRHLSL